MASSFDPVALNPERDPSFVWRAPGAAPDGPWTAPEGYLVILMLAASCDCGMGRLESDLLQHLTHRWCANGIVREKDLPALEAACVARLANGPEVLSEACAALPARAHAAVFAHALDIMLCDRAIRPEEAAFATRLAAELGLSGADAERIGAVLAAKNAY